jgi:hypothetical protein
MLPVTVAMVNGNVAVNVNVVAVDAVVNVADDGVNTTPIFEQ